MIGRKEWFNIMRSFKKFLSSALAGAMLLALPAVPAVRTQAAEVGEYNYAKLLQESLYFYDANMCGTDVGEKSAFSWRDDCHVNDTVMIDGVKVDVSGGYHDAGDHGKFGLPQAYSATMLGVAYHEFKQAFKDTESEKHLKLITDRFCEYFEKCTVLNSDGSVKCFIYQVGDYTDHNYWGAPENQTGSRPVFYTSDSNTATDEVSEAAAALAMQYLNFNDTTALSYAEKLFQYARQKNKMVATEGLWDNSTNALLYKSTSWGDDYALAAALLYKATGNNSYKSEFENVRNNGLGSYNIYAWFSWDDVSAIADYYGTGNASALLSCANNMKASDSGYSCLLEWGSARYNCNTQFIGLMYDKANGSNSYKNWAYSQMNYLLGNNSNKQCYVVGYNSNSSKYPHHRAASASYDAGQISANRHTLLGALVGGPSNANGDYNDSQSDYKCNEVALDYNAGLVGAAAGLYLVYKGDTGVASSLMTKADLDGTETRFSYITSQDEEGGEQGGSSGINNGSDTGSGENTGSSTGKDTGSGSGENTGSNTGSEVNTGSSTGKDTGSEVNTGSSTGKDTGSEVNTGSNTGSNTGNTGKDSASGSGENTGSNTGNTGKDTGSGADTGSNTGSNTGSTGKDAGSVSGDNTTNKIAQNSSANNSDKTMDNQSGSNTAKTAVTKDTEPEPCNEWIDGKWYDANGNQSYSGELQWKANSTGWWVEDTSGWYPVSEWQKIDGIWYYFNSDGYMASGEYYNGYWFNDDGSWAEEYYLSWKVNSTGWWVEDISGWWPSGSWLKINGCWYYFNSSGYMETDTYVDGYWLGSDGVCY